MTLKIFSLDPVLLVLLTFVGIYFFKKVILNRNKLPLPPGPRPYPIIGNLLDLPTPDVPSWKHWLKFKDQYGPVSSITILGQTFVFLQDLDVTLELLEQRSAYHSSRVSLTFGSQMVGWDRSLIILPYSPRWRAYRKNIAQVIGTSALVSRFHPLLDVESKRFLLRVMRDPENFQKHIRTEAVAIILKISYDYTIEPHKPDPLVNLAETVLNQATQLKLGKFLVDAIPYLQYLPDWFPGTGFKQVAKQWRSNLDRLSDLPYYFVKEQMKRGQNNNSFVSDLLVEDNPSAEDEFNIKWSASSLYTGGADTTVSAIEAFFLVMTQYPEVQRKAQEEIDKQVGTKRLPDFKDRPNLPYVEALLKELLRWHPIGGNGFPHMTTDEDVCNGYRIPKGAMLVPNVWFFTHDPDIYDDPMTFRPERFLLSNGRQPDPDPLNLAFGFGRRKCPGRVLAEDSIYITVVRSLAAFDIAKKKDLGREIDPLLDFTPDIISHPREFEARITPRSKEHAVLIQSVELEHPWEEGDAQLLESFD